MSTVAGASLAGSSSLPEISDADGDEAQGHLSTLVKAHGILNNPQHMARIHGLVGRHVAAVKGIKSTEDLKNIFDEKYGGSVKGSDKGGKQQESDLNSDHASLQKGDGSDGNSGSEPYGSHGHSASSPKQQNPLKYSKPGKSGSGNDGN